VVRTFTIVDRDHMIAALDEEWEALIALAGDLAPGDWSHATDLPGWTVKDVYAHIIGIESVLLGRQGPGIVVPDGLPHVRNELGRANEAWVLAYRPCSGSEVLADLAEVVTERRAMLARTDAAAFDAPSWTPAGEDTYGRFMRIRVMDQWFHEQDVREAVGRPGHLSGLAPEVVLDELSSAMGYVVGKQANFPEGSSVRINLRGPMSHRWDIAVTDRARIVDQLSGEPTVTITMPGATFCRIAGGRREWNHPWVRSAIVVYGDHDLGDQLLANLAFMP